MSNLASLGTGEQQFTGESGFEYKGKCKSGTTGKGDVTTDVIVCVIRVEESTGVTVSRYGVCGTGVKGREWTSGLEFLSADFLDGSFARLCTKAALPST